MFLLVYSNQDDNAERFKVRRYSLPEGVIKNYYIITNGKSFYDQLIGSGINRKKVINRTSWRLYYRLFFLVCEYMKIHYGLIAVDLSGPKELEADPKAIQ